MRPKAFFSGPGLDRADQLRIQPDEIAKLAERDDSLELVWRDGLPAMDHAGRLVWQPMRGAPIFLGLDGSAPRFSALTEPAAMAFSVLPLIAQLDDGDAPLFAAALSLSRWHSRHRFCANCGHESALIRGGWARSCPNCAAEHFPRVDPVAIMLVEHDGNVLLGRQPHYPVGRYSALAGFIEVGESIEDAVAREIREEAGIDVSHVRYVASQPWPFPSSLMIGCTATAASAALTIDTTELEDARWFSREEVARAIRAMTMRPSSRRRAPRSRGPCSSIGSALKPRKLAPKSGAIPFLPAPGPTGKLHGRSFQHHCRLGAVRGHRRAWNFDRRR